MRSFILVVLAVVILSAALPAAQTATVAAPKAGDYYYWIAYNDVNGKPATTAPVGFEKKATVDLPLVKDAVPKSKLYVLDVKTGVEAIRPIEGKPPYKYELKAADFKFVRRLRVAVSSATSKFPAAAGIVKLVDADKGAQTQILDPTMNGVAQFTDIPSGAAKIMVEYDDGKTLSQDVDITLDNPSPVIQILVSGSIETLKPAEAGQKPTTTKSKGGTGGINFATALIGLILFVGVLWLAVRMMSNRGAGFRQIMKRVGVDLPGEPEPVSAPGSPAQVVDPTICPFCGNKKDPTTGACACTVGAGTTAAGGASTGPRLVATQGVYAGSIYALEGDAVIIGREESNAIAFPQDSTVSRKHARISNANGEFTIHDEGSSNGVFVNGVKVTEQALKPGDEVQIGNTRLRFET